MKTTKRKRQTLEERLDDACNLYDGADGDYTEQIDAYTAAMLESVPQWLTECLRPVHPTEQDIADVRHAAALLRRRIKKATPLMKRVVTLLEKES